METRLLKGPLDHEALCAELEKGGIDPSVFKDPPDTYPALACWVERDINSMRYGWDANGDYVYPSIFDEEPDHHICPVCDSKRPLHPIPMWGLPYMCRPCYSYLSGLSNQGTDVNGLLWAQGKIW